MSHSAVPKPAVPKSTVSVRGLVSETSLDRGSPASDASEPQLSKRAKWLLVLFGSLFGILFGVGVGFFLRSMKTQSLPEGSTFESLGDFRNALNQRDTRDLKDDNSVSLRSIMVSDPSDQIIYRLAPKLDVKFQGVRVRTNSLGLRGSERSLEKPPGVYRIAVLGDSFTFGWGVEEEKIFVNQLERLLNTSGGIAGKQVEVLNFGVPGYSTFQETALFQQYASKFQPDAVLVFFIENDFGLPFFIKNLGSVSNDEMMTNNGFAKSASSADPDVQKRRSELISLLDANQALARLADSSKQLGIPFFLAINPGKSAPKIVERLTVLKQRNDILHLWLRDAMLSKIKDENINPRDLTLPTDPHPSALKHRFLAELLLAELRKHLHSSASAASS